MGSDQTMVLRGDCRCSLPNHKSASYWAVIGRESKSHEGRHASFCGFGSSHQGLTNSWTLLAPRPLAPVTQSELMRISMHSRTTVHQTVEEKHRACHLCKAVDDKLVLQEGFDGSESTPYLLVPHNGNLHSKKAAGWAIARLRLALTQNPGHAHNTSRPIAVVEGPSLFQSVDMTWLSRCVGGRAGQQDTGGMGTDHCGLSVSP